VSRPGGGSAVPSLDFGGFEWVSFDCYGTLVDWETGISTAVGEVLESHGVRKSKAEVLALFADAEPRVQGSGDFQEYRTVLRRVMAAIGEEVGITCSESELACLSETLPRWPVFPEVVDALNALQSRCRLAVISNVDDDLFAGTARALGVDFDAVVTAQQVRSYKPSLGNFHAARERMGVERDRWLHVAESLYHDIGPANRLGIKSVWVNRAGSGGGTRRVDAVPDLVVPDLAALAGMIVQTRCDAGCSSAVREPPSLRQAQDGPKPSPSGGRTRRLTSTGRDRRIPMSETPKVHPFLWFDGQAEEAARFYVSVFPDSGMLKVERAPSGPGEGAAVVEFEIGGQRFGAVDGGPMYKLTPAISFVVSCDSQEEIDHYWDRLSEGGTQSQCGWLEDKFGVSWQVVPAMLDELMGGDPEGVMGALMTMQKIDIEQLRQASRANQ